MITIPIRNITAPPGWPKPGNGHNDPTATYNWIKETWPQVSLRQSARWHRPCPRGSEGVAGLSGRIHRDWPAWRAVRSASRATLCCAALLAAAPAAEAGHEVPYYPSFYPQEIRIEPLDPAAAAPGIRQTTAPLTPISGPARASTAGAGLRQVGRIARRASHGGVNPSVAREPRCALSGARRTPRRRVAKEPDTVAHPYPITPYHADYLGHVDRVPASPPAGCRSDGARDLRREIADREAWSTALIRRLGHPRGGAVGEVLRAAGVGIMAGRTAWAKEGWFQAYHLLRPAVGERGSGRARRRALRAAAAWRLQGPGRAAQSRARAGGGARPKVASAASSAIGCGASSSATTSPTASRTSPSTRSPGSTRPIVVRTVKLKDFPWNGWLRARHRQRGQGRLEPGRRLHRRRRAGWCGRRWATMPICPSPTTAAGCTTAPRSCPTTMSASRASRSSSRPTR